MRIFINALETVMEGVFNGAKDSKRPKFPIRHKGLNVDRAGLGREQGPECSEGGGSVYWQGRKHVWSTWLNIE